MDQTKGSAPVSEQDFMDQIKQAIYSEFKGVEKTDKTASLKKGKALRKQVSRRAQGEWTVQKQREDGVNLLKQQENTRVKELLSIRHERMQASAFAFYRGSAVIMAADLAKTPSTGIKVQACGDAHIANFGIFSSPERRLVLDINDFDETLPAPWEWDIKRLVASVEICGRQRGFSSKVRKKAVREAAEVYRKSMRHFSEMGNLDVWYAHMDVASIFESATLNLEKAEAKTIQKVMEKALSKNNDRAVAKLTKAVDGKLQIISDPPLLVPLRELGDKSGRIESAQKYLSLILKQYRLSLPRERRTLIDQYSIVDMARKVVGVGSVGTKAWVIVLEGSDARDPLVLQIKEATESVLEPYAGKSPFLEHGRRVVEGQRAAQTAGDILTGWVTVPDPDGGKTDFYVRQLWNGKGSIDLDTIPPDGLIGFSAVCAWLLAHT
ncbi:MAG: DUF2252 domain-containing protein, partial [Eubacteriaceae bacterium]|nr:DUF2252 domain-containing protein [Eubacteriaceae bacterium]